MLFLLGAAIPGCSTSQCRPFVCVETPHYNRRCQDWSASLAARHAAWKSLNQQRIHCPDYRRGYLQAHADLARGSCGQVPPVPPARYWNPCFRTCEGQQRVAAWYEGYQAGLAHARACLGNNTIHIHGGECEPWGGAAGYAGYPATATQGVPLSGCPCRNGVPSW